MVQEVVLRSTAGTIHKPTYSSQSHHLQPILLRSLRLCCYKYFPTQLHMMALARVGGFMDCSCCRSKDDFLNHVTRQNSATTSEYRTTPGQLISFTYFWDHHRQ